MMKFNEVRALVNSYVSAMKAYDELKEKQEKINNTLSFLGISGISLELSRDEKVETKEQFSKNIQKKGWRYIFNKMKIEKYLTKGVMNDINKFVETQQNIPFTMKNIYKMFEIIVGTSQQNFNRALEEVIDNFTKHTHENRYSVEGWKTNSGYMLNRKFITGWCVESNWNGGLQIKDYNSNFERVTDLVKVLCNITGTNYDTIPNIRYASCDKTNEGFLTEKGTRVKSYSQTGYDNRIINYNLLQPNIWYKWGFFEFKVFKKGTMHLRFINEKDWYKLNQAYGKLKGFTLPE